MNNITVKQNNVNNVNNEDNINDINNINNFEIINPNLESDYDKTIHENIELIIKNEQYININSDSDTIYKTLLDEIFDTIEDNNQLFRNNNINITRPDIKYENRKTFWYNYGKNCSQINRSVEQLKKFFENELAVETSINDKLNLIFRGKYSFNIIASTYKKYIKNYVQCTTCKSILTEIIRNSSNRLDYLKCLNAKCNSSKVVVKI